jgi:hypothetical protein
VSSLSIQLGNHVSCRAIVYEDLIIRPTASESLAVRRVRESIDEVIVCADGFLILIGCARVKDDGSVVGSRSSAVGALLSDGDGVDCLVD